MNIRENTLPAAAAYFEDAKDMLSLCKPRHALLSVRQALESIVYDLSQKAGIETKNENGNIPLSDLIDTLHEYNVITSSDAENLHRIRILGNMGVHLSGGPTPTMEQAQEGVYLLSIILDKSESYAQELTPRQKAILAELCVENGKITQAESWCQSVLTDGRDSVACAIALYSLCCISGTDQGEIITEQILNRRATEGSTVAMGALILWLSKQNPFLFHSYDVSNIEREQYIVGFVTDTRNSDIKLDFGDKMVGYISTGELYRKVGDGYCGVARTEVKIGTIIEAYIKSQTVSGVQLDNGTLHERDDYKTILSAGRSMLSLFDHIREKDPVLAKFLQPKIDQSRSALKKAEAVKAELELEETRKKAKAQMASENKNKHTALLRLQAILAIIIPWMIFGDANIRKCIGICIVAFLGYRVYRYFKNKRAQK